MKPQPPPSPLRLTQNSRKRNSRAMMFEMDMEPDVIEISPPPPITRNTNRHSNKPKKVILHEVIDVDNDEDSPDVMILDEKVDTKNKGKVIQENSDDYVLAKDDVANYLFVPSKGSDPGSHEPIIIGGSDSDIVYNNEYMDIPHDDFMNFDDYEYLQTHLDNVDFPPGVEASIPSLLDFVHETKKTVDGSDSLDATNQKNPHNLNEWLSKPSGVGNKLLGSSSGFQVSLDTVSHASGADLSSHWSSTHTAINKKKLIAWQQEESIMNPTSAQRKKKTVAASSSTNHTSVNQLHKATVPPFDNEAWGHYIHVNNQVNPANPFCPSFPSDMGGLNPAVVTPSMSWSKSNSKSSFPYLTGHSEFYDPLYSAQNLPEEDAARTPKYVNKDDILSKYKNFKRFDTIEDHSDHFYTSKCSSIKQPPKNWAKKIQEEWRILENDLPDTIFVRAYESRMDLLRAVIIGAEGTPYHDGLFFFDIFFPSGYPNVPPNVHYHSGGLRLNPNLYKCGKVCLSLLGTWHGNKNEKWLPGVSTVLQVLLSIQALILNQKPFFNEPGYESMSGTAHGEKESRQYNESTFTLSLKTMVYTMRRPPKHFEDFVMGHFHKYAHDILVACKAYMEGAQVGCLVKGGVQDVDEGDKSSSRSFQHVLPGSVDLLLKEFSLIGIEDIEKFRILVKGNINGVGNVPRMQ